MVRISLAAVLGCALAAPARAQSEPPRRLLDPPVYTLRPEGALPAFPGAGVDVTIGWRPVGEAVRYRATFTNVDTGESTDVDTTALRIDKRGLAPGHYQLTIGALDATGMVGALSEPLPLNVIEVRAVPPGAAQPMPPTRGAYVVGTRFSVAGMHCEASEARIDDLLVRAENELRVTRPGRTTLYCAGLPGYLEAEVLIAPVTVALRSPQVTRGTTTTVHVTIGSVARVGDQLAVAGLGDVTVGVPIRTTYGLDVPVTVPLDATAGRLAIQSDTFELGHVDLALVAPPPPAAPPPRPSLDWQALELGGQLGAFFPPSEGGGATTIGDPTAAEDAVTGGPLVGTRLGFFPIPRLGLEAELSLAAGGYVDESTVSRLLVTRAQLAIRALESGRFGLRLIAGGGAWTTLREHGTSQRSTVGEAHAGLAVTVETSPNLWLRFQLLDLVTSARENAYAHVIEGQLGIVTRFGRRDSF